MAADRLPLLLRIGFGKSASGMSHKPLYMFPSLGSVIVSRIIVLVRNMLLRAAYRDKKKEFVKDELFYVVYPSEQAIPANAAEAVSVRV